LRDGLEPTINMDINSKIHLSPGVQFTAETVNSLFGSLFQRQTAVIRSVNSGRIGAVPGHANSVRGVFVRDTVEVEIHDFIAVFPSGEVANIDETAVIKMPLLYGNRYYLTVKVSDSVVNFESNGIPFVRNEYAYAISTFEEMVSSCCFPLLRFNVKDGIFSIDDSFIIPCLVMENSPHIAECISDITNHLRTMAEHPNNADRVFRFSALNNAFRLNSYDNQARVSNIIQTTREIASAIDYFVVRQYSSDPEPLYEPSLYDIEDWFSWLSGYIDRAIVILDGVVVEKEEIDLEAIKQELRAEIYDHIQPDLEQMVNNRVDNLSEALQTRIEEVLKDYVNGKILGELRESLRLQLDSDLRAILYSDLYQALYAVLFVPKEEEEDTYVPLI